MTTISKYQHVAVILLILTFCIATTSTAQKKKTKPVIVFKLFKLKHRLAKELLPSVESILSPNGKASVDIISNSLMIIDHQKNIDHALKIIEKLDYPVPQLSIQLRYRFNNTRNKYISSTGIISVKGIKLSTGKNEQVQKLLLRVRSGSSAFLKISRQVPFTNHWLSLCRRNGYNFGWFSDYKTIGTGLALKAVALTNTVDLTMTPIISFSVGKAIEFIQSATRVVIPYDSWVTINSAKSKSNETYALILGKKQKLDSTLQIQVKASLAR